MTDKMDIWEWSEHRTRATELKPNITLITKDGSNAGNMLWMPWIFCK